jgi:hypothetical protein
MRESAPSSRRRAVRDILLYGACGGVLIAVLNLMQYRFLVVEHSVVIYVALVAPSSPGSASGWDSEFQERLTSQHDYAGRFVNRRSCDQGSAISVPSSNLRSSWKV